MEHPSGITYQTDELERIERVRYALFLVFALALFVTFVLLSQSALWSAAFAASGALLASGWYAAHATTRDPAWAIVEAEARQDGGNPNKHSVWAANLLPGTAALCGLTLWLGVA
jgi:hypothetical protein